MRLATRTTAVVAGIALGACSSSPPVPLYEVVPRDFDHRIRAEGFLRADNATQVTVPGDVRHGGRILWMVEDGAAVEEGEVVMRLDHYELEQRLEEEVAELETADVEHHRTATEGRSSVDGAITRKELAGLELDHAEKFRRTDDSIFSRSEIAESRIDADVARTRQDSAEKLEGIHQDRARAELEEVGVGRRLAGIEVDLARAALASLDLRAPSRGVLMWERDWRGETPQIGEQVVRREVVAQIPDLSSVGAEVFVLEADASGVRKGQSAEVTIEAHPERVHVGRVVRIDPVAKRRFRGSPAQYVGVSLSLEDLGGTMKPGQRVNASILADHQSDGLVVPRQALFVDEDGYYVHLAKDDGFVRRDVTVRAIAPALALLEEGLAQGDRVALEEPSVGSVAERSPDGSAGGSPSG